MDFMLNNFNICCLQRFKEKIRRTIHFRRLNITKQLKSTIGSYTKVIEDENEDTTLIIIMRKDFSSQGTH